MTCYRRERWVEETAVQATVQAARSAGRLLAQAGQTAARVASAVLSWSGAALAAASPVLVLVLIAGMVGAFLASPCEFVAGVTDVRTGKPVYFCLLYTSTSTR